DPALGIIPAAVAVVVVPRSRLPVGGCRVGRRHAAARRQCRARRRRRAHPPRAAGGGLTRDPSGLPRHHPLPNDLSTDSEARPDLAVRSARDVGGRVFNGSMKDLTEILERLDTAVGDAFAQAYDGECVRGADDDALLTAAAVAARISRRLDGFL